MHFYGNCVSIRSDLFNECGVGGINKLIVLQDLYQEFTKCVSH